MTAGSAYAKAKVFLSAGREGEKKYSPPFGTTHVGRVSEVLWLLGLVPIIERAPAAFCPMMGSNPETSVPRGFPLGGKVGVSAQPEDYQLTFVE